MEGVSTRRLDLPSIHRNSFREQYVVCLSKSVLRNKGPLSSYHFHPECGRSGRVLHATGLAIADHNQQNNRKPDFPFLLFLPKYVFIYIYIVYFAYIYHLQSTSKSLKLNFVIFARMAKLYTLSAKNNQLSRKKTET